MNKKIYKSYYHNNTIGIKLFIVCLILQGLLLQSCSNNKKGMAPAITDPSAIPTMTSTGISTLISDSGKIRYKIISEKWDIYSNEKISKWAFEKGVYLERYDNFMNIEAKVKADTAYYYDKKKLWDLRGHVSILNIQGEKFNTEQLFWDQAQETVYSDKFIRIQQIDKILTGYGFNSNQQFTDYIIHNTAGIFPIEDKVPQDTTIQP